MGAYFYLVTASFPSLQSNLKWLCGSVGRVVASNTRGPRFESSHRLKFIYIEQLFPVNCVLKRRK